MIFYIIDSKLSYVPKLSPKFYQILFSLNKEFLLFLYSYVGLTLRLSDFLYFSSY